MMLAWLFPEPSKERWACRVRHQERGVMTAASVRRKSRREHGEGRRGHHPLASTTEAYSVLQAVVVATPQQVLVRQICACMRELWNQAR